MTYFSRLSDIVSCNLQDLLRRSAAPEEELAAVISEMEQGLTAARRSAQSATQAEARLQQELRDNRTQIQSWTNRAREELVAGNDTAARQALLRKHELSDLTASLEQHHAAASSTRDQLTMTLRAIEARLAEAYRLRQSLLVGESAAESTVAAHSFSAVSAPAGDHTRATLIEDELEQLRRELGQSV